MKATRTWEIILVFLLLIVVAGFSATTEGFLDFYNLSDSTFNYSEKALIALVMALVIIAGEIDISVAATVALTSVMMGLAKNAGAGVDNGCRKTCLAHCGDYRLLVGRTGQPDPRPFRRQIDVSLHAGLPVEYLFEPRRAGGAGHTH